MASDFALDIGTSSIRLASSSDGILFNEPTVAAIDTRSGEIAEIGYGALEMVAHTSRHVVAFRPFSQGTTIDFDVTARLLSGLFARSSISKFSRVRVVMSVPSLATSIERRALRQAAIQAGAREVSLIEAPIAAAIGMGLPVQDPVGSAVTLLGGGASESALLSLGGIVTTSTRRQGGINLDNAIASALRQQLNVVVSPTTAEQLKMALASALGRTSGRFEVVTARTVDSGALVEVSVSADLVNNAIRDLVNVTVRMVQDSLGGAPPDLSQDVSTRGMAVVGGHAQLAGLTELISTSTGVKVNVVEESDLVVIRGLQLCLDEMSSLHSLFRDADR